MATADEEWFCRIDGRVEGPLSVRTLRTMAALGELIPTDEVRCGLDGRWHAARLVQGFRFGSTVRAPGGDQVRQDAPRATKFAYKMVQIPPTIQIEKTTPKETAAAVYLERLVNEHAGDGWEFYRIDTIGVRVNPGCLGALLLGFSGQGVITEQYFVVTFRKPV
jgi:GYF domain 2